MEHSILKKRFAGGIIKVQKRSESNVLRNLPKYKKVRLTIDGTHLF